MVVRVRAKLPAGHRNPLSAGRGLPEVWTAELLLPDLAEAVSLVYLKNKAPGLAVRNFIRAVFPEGAKGGSSHA